MPWLKLIDFDGYFIVFILILYVILFWGEEKRTLRRGQNTILYHMPENTVCNATCSPVCHAPSCGGCTAIHPYRFSWHSGMAVGRPMQLDLLVLCGGNMVANHNYHPHMRVSNVFGHVCLCVCVSLYLSVFLSVQAITFEPLDIETSFLVCRYILTISRLSLSIKGQVSLVKVKVIWFYLFQLANPLYVATGH